VLCVVGFLEKSIYATEYDASADGSGNAMAKVIEFYVPTQFRKKRLWIPTEQRGKLIELPSPEKQSA